MDGSAILNWLAFILAVILFWMLVFRIIAAYVRLDPYHPVTQFIYRFTDYYVRPFRFGPFRKPARIDLAVIPPLLILLIIIILTVTNL
jgi:uncharacterized protein YggT (Ycf19 family)